jgi:CheY-like chemotaxis protein
LPGKFVHIEVKDNGCGMDEETLQRVFDPFYTTKFMGRGLGMSAILGIVRGHGGSIVVESSIETGTTIRVLLPVAKCSAIAQRESEDSGAMRRLLSAGTATVLVVDDDEMVRDVCKKMIELLGVRTLEASNGEVAVKLFAEKRQQISCVLMDFSMPRMDGITAFEELRKIDPAVKVLLSSGYDEEDATRRFSEKGLSGFIQKPYEMERLKRVLLRVLAG